MSDGQTDNDPTTRVDVETLRVETLRKVEEAVRKCRHIAWTRSLRPMHAQKTRDATMIALWHHEERNAILNDEKRLQGLVDKIARGEFTKTVNERPIERPLEEFVYLKDKRTESPSARMEMKDCSALIEFATGKLTERQRDIVRLRFYEDRTLKNIAEKYDVTVPAIRKSINKITEKLYDSLEKLEGDLR